MTKLDSEAAPMSMASALRTATFARPLDGGAVITLDPAQWEIDDPLPRFATGALNLERWTDPDAPPTHRIFVDAAQFDRWLAALKPSGVLTNREVDEIGNPQVRAARAAAARTATADMSAVGGREPERSVPNDPNGLSPVLLTVEEVSKLIGRSRSTIYQDEKDGNFPERIKVGFSARWKKSEVIAWIEERAAWRGG